MANPSGASSVATPTLTTARLRLQPLTPADATEMTAVLADPDLYAFTGGEPPSAQELEATYHRWVAGSPRAGEAWHNWVVRLGDGGPVIGHVQATVTRDGRAADIAWLIGTAWQGRGYASEAARALVEWLTAEKTTIVSAHIHPDHGASGRVAAAAGLETTDEVRDGEVVWRRR